jgi:hypothetical protein
MKSLKSIELEDAFQVPFYGKHYTYYKCKKISDSNIGSDFVYAKTVGQIRQKVNTISGLIIDHTQDAINN